MWDYLPSISIIPLLYILPFSPLPDFPLLCSLFPLTTLSPSPSQYSLSISLLVFYLSFSFIPLPLSPASSYPFTLSLLSYLTANLSFICLYLISFSCYVSFISFLSLSSIPKPSLFHLLSHFTFFSLSFLSSFSLIYLRRQKSLGSLFSKLSCALLMQVLGL